MISSTPSEPIVAEAAAQVLRHQNMVDLLSQNVREGLIEKGQRGELVARLLFKLAHDRALENMVIAHKDNQGQLKKLYTSPIPSSMHSFHSNMSTAYSIVIRIIAKVA